MSFALGLISVVPLWAAGAGVLRGAGLAEGRLRDLPLELAAGVTLLTVVGSLMVASGVPLSLAGMYPILAAPVLWGFWRRRLRLRPDAGWPEDTVARGLLTATGLLLAVLLVASFQDRLAWDAWAVWTLKGIMLFHEGGFPADIYDAPGPFDHTHPEYPLAVPLVQWWMFRHAGAPLPALSSALGAVWVVALVALFWDSARTLAPARLAALGTLGVAAFWPLTRYAIGGYADVWMSLAVLGVVTQLHAAMVASPEGQAPALWRAAIFAALGAATKHEGMVLAGILLVLAGGWLLRRRRLSPGTLAPLLLPLALAGPWLLYTRAQQITVEQLGSFGQLAFLGERIPILARHVAGLSFSRSWIPLPWIALAGVVLAAVGRRRDLVLPWTLLGLYMAAAVSVYFTTSVNVDWLVGATLDRVVSHLVPATVLLTLAASALPHRASAERQDARTQSRGHMNILVTGGAGFIGSAVVRRLIRETDHHVINVDRLTYAANLESLEEVGQDPRYVFEGVDICDAGPLRQVFERHRPDAVLHLAAESHVDRSIDGPDDFVRTNVLGTFTLLEEARRHWQGLDAEGRERFRFVHVSTDEVFGALGETGVFDESTAYDPSSPYSATKAASDHLARAWHRTYGLPVIVTNCSNNYGPFQFPEKLIPLMILNALEAKELPVYGRGENVRDWIHVDDHAAGLVATLERGLPGATYLFGGRAERRNLEVVKAICDAVDGLAPDPDLAPRRDLIRFVEDRPGHDFRYAIDPSRAERELGWLRRYDFTGGLRSTVAWYLEHREWWQRVRSGAYRGERLGLGGSIAGGGRPV